MSDLHHISRRPVVAGIGAAALAALLYPSPVRAQAFDRPPRVLVFDVAETLLDLQVLRPLFQRIFGGGAMVDDWASGEFDVSLYYALIASGAIAGFVCAAAARLIGLALRG